MLNNKKIAVDFDGLLLMMLIRESEAKDLRFRNPEKVTVRRIQTYTLDI